MMFANYIEASISTVTAATPDTFTLAAITGSPNFDKIPGITGTRIVRYTAIQYTDSTRATISKIQSGIGSLVISTLVLTQTLIQETWDGTTFDNTAPAELTFTAGADTTRVHISPMVQDFVRSYPGTAVIDGSMGSSTSFGVWPLNAPRGASTFAAVAGTEYYKPILWAGQSQIDQATVRTGGATAGNCKLGWYEMGPDGKPGALLKDFGAFAISAGANNVVAVTGFNPPPGWYWELHIFDAAITVLQTTMALLGPCGVTSGGSTIFGYTRAGDYATGLPATGSVVSPTAIVGTPLSTACNLPATSYRMAA